MKKQTSFLQALGLNENSFAALSGGGGKTSLLTRLFEEALEGGIPVAASTTAKMMRPDFSENLVISPDMDAQALFYLMKASGWRDVFIAGGEEDGKVTSVKDAFLNDFKGAMSESPYLLIIEADGSARKPYRIRSAHDPKIPESATVSIHLIGAEVGQSVLNEDVIHRCPDALIEEFPDEALLRKLVEENKPPVKRGTPAYLVINKADQYPDGASRLSRTLEGSFDKIFLSSIREGWIEEADKGPCPVLLAAGLSRRMKLDTPKLLLPFEGRTILEAAVDAVEAASGKKPFVVVREKVMEAVPAEIPFAVNPKPENGMGSSLAVAAREMEKRGESGMLVYLADIPVLSGEISAQVMEAVRKNPGKIIRPVCGDKPVHPVYFPSRFFGELSTLTGDEAGRRVMRAHPQAVVEISVPQEDLSFDVDTVEDYRKLTKRKDL